jgi:hypothetical protein
MHFEMVDLGRPAREHLPKHPPSRSETGATGQLLGDLAPRRARQRWRCRLHLRRSRLRRPRSRGPQPLRPVRGAGAPAR